MARPSGCPKKKDKVKLSSMKSRSWKVLHSQLLLDRRYLQVMEQKVELPNGEKIDDFALVQSPSWAAMVCLTADRDLVLVEQYRHGHEGLSLELPAGIVDPGEDPVQAATRELAEETGYGGESPSTKGRNFVPGFGTHETKSSTEGK